jgi:hypothetical protein
MSDALKVLVPLSVGRDSMLGVWHVVQDTLTLVREPASKLDSPLLQTLLGGALAIAGGFFGKLFDQGLQRRSRRNELIAMAILDLSEAAVVARRMANSLSLTGELADAALDHLTFASAAIEARRSDSALLPDEGLRRDLVEWIGYLHVIRTGVADFKERVRELGEAVASDPAYQPVRAQLASSFNFIAREGAFLVEQLGGAVVLPAEPKELPASVDPRAEKKIAWRARQKRK